MKKYIKNSFLLIGIWFIVSILISAILRFAAYLFSIECSYKIIFLHLYLWGLLIFMILLTAAHIFFFPWLKVYKRETSKGVKREVAFDIACKEVRIRLPKRLLFIVVEYRL